jgi:hypothetical protein
MRLRRPSPARVSGFTALVAATGGAAVATVPARDGDVHFCYSKRTGAVEVVDTQLDRFACDQNWRGFVLDSKPSALVSPDGLTRVDATDEGITMVSRGYAVRLSKRGVFTVDSKTATVNGEDKVDSVTGSASIRMLKDGSIVIAGSGVAVQASGDVTIKGSKVAQNRR